MKALIIYHRADSDGLLSEAIVRTKLAESGDQITSIGMDYEDPTPELPQFDVCYMVDFTQDELLSHQWFRHKTILIDHHKTALEKWSPHRNDFLGFHLKEGRGACMTAWEIMHPDEHVHEFIVWVGMRDVWAHKGMPIERDAELIELGLRSEWPPDFEALLKCPEDETERLWRTGRAVERYAKTQLLELAKRGAHLLHWSGLRFLCLNSQQRGSPTLEELADMLRETEPTWDALMVWALGRDGKTVNVSMYHDAHSQLIDLSKIAKDHGGGGHPGACGFRIPVITWALLINEGARSLCPSGSNTDENQTVR